MTSAPVILFPHTAGEGVCERLAAMRAELDEIAAGVVGVHSAELAAVAAQASAVVAAAEAARAAVVVEASTRGCHRRVRPSASPVVGGTVVP